MYIFKGQSICVLSGYGSTLHMAEFLLSAHMKTCICVLISVYVLVHTCVSMNVGLCVHAYL